MPDNFLSGICGHRLFVKFMRLKILSKRALLVLVVLSGSAFLIALFLYFISKGLIQGGSTSVIENTTALINQEQTSVGLPVRLKIPNINVDSFVEYVGLTSEGAMGAPKEPADVAWFSLGVRPGEDGSAVIAGHYGWKNGIKSAFDNLYKLRRGDKVYIEDDKGVTISFVVRESRRYDPNSDASDVFNSSDGRAHLNLVTCEGVWNAISKNYSKRLVIFTDKE